MWTAVVDENRRGRTGECPTNDLYKEEGSKSRPDWEAGLLAWRRCRGGDKREEWDDGVHYWETVEEDTPGADGAETLIDDGIEKELEGYADGS